MEIQKEEMEIRAYELHKGLWNIFDRYVVAKERRDQTRYNRTLVLADLIRDYLPKQIELLEKEIANEQAKSDV